MQFSASFTVSFKKSKNINKMETNLITVADCDSFISLTSARKLAKKLAI